MIGHDLPEKPASRDKGDGDSFGKSQLGEQCESPNRYGPVSSEHKVLPAWGWAKENPYHMFGCMRGSLTPSSLVTIYRYLSDCIYLPS